MKKINAALLCFVMLMSLCACGRDEEKTEPILEADVDTPFYTKEALNCPEPGGSFGTAVGAGDSVIACTVSSEGKYRLFRMDTGTSDFAPIDCAVPTSPETLDGLSDGRAALSWHDESGALIVCEIGADNSAVTHTLSLPEELEGALIFDLKAVESGYVFTAYEGNTPCIYLVDRQGALLNHAAYDKYNELYILRGRDDSLTLACWKDEETVFQIIDGDLTVRAEYNSAAQFREFINGGGSGEIIGVLPLGKACIQTLETGELRGYCSLADGKISRRGVVPLSDTELFCIDGGQASIWRVSEGTERVTLKMQTNLQAVSWLADTLAEAISGFNNSNEKYCIELVDYGVYGEQAEQMLLADLMDGKTPDIFDLNALNTEGCYKNKLLENLKPFFDADADIDYEDIVPAVRRVTERDGGTYELIPQFTVSTMFAPASVVGEGKFTAESLIALAEEYGAERLFGQSKTGERLLLEAITYSNDFIDERESRCSFDSPDFISLLELAKKLPTEAVSAGYDDVYFGDALLFHTSLSKLDGADGLAEIDAIYHGNWRSVGFPSAGGTGVTLSPRMRLGMAANSQNKEGVWEFFKYLMSSQYQRSIKQALPALAESLEQIMDAQMQIGETVSLGMLRTDGNGGFTQESLKIGLPTAAMKAQLLEIIDSIDGMNEYDPALLETVQSEAARFFAGDCTAEEAAASIQSKASIYLSEQYG